MRLTTPTYVRYKGETFYIGEVDTTETSDGGWEQRVRLVAVHGGGGIWLGITPRDEAWDEITVESESAYADVY